MISTATILPQTVTDNTSILLTSEENIFVKLVSSNIVSQILNNEESNSLPTLQ